MAEDWYKTNINKRRKEIRIYPRSKVPNTL